MKNLRYFKLIDHQIFIGSFPFSGDIDTGKLYIHSLIKKGVNSFVDLTEPKEKNSKGVILQEYYSSLPKDIKYINIPISDSLNTRHSQWKLAIDFIKQPSYKDDFLYIHCRGGLYRSIIFSYFYIYYNNVNIKLTHSIDVVEKSKKIDKNYIIPNHFNYEYIIKSFYNIHNFIS